MTQDTRKDRRVKIVSLNVRYKSATVDEFIDNHAHDVSRGGIYIKTSSPFPPGTLLKFEIRLASDQAVIAGVGRVVWKRDASQATAESPAGMGVKFIKLDDPSKAVIDKLVNTRSDAGRAFESEVEAPMPSVSGRPGGAASLGPNPPAAAAPAQVNSAAPPPVGIPAVTASAAPRPAAGAGAPMHRKATMMGLGIPTATATPTPPGVGSRTPAPPPRSAAANAGGAMFPKTNSEEEPGKNEQTVMKQAAELLEEALREAGGSMDDIGTNPLFSGSDASSPVAAKEAKDPVAASRDVEPVKAVAIGEPETVDFDAPKPRSRPPEETPPVPNEAERARAMVAEMSPAPAGKRLSEPPRTSRESPVAKGTSERPPAARASDYPVKKKGGSGGVIVAVLAAAALAGVVAVFHEKIFGANVAPPPAPTPAVTASVNPPSTPSAASAAPSASETSSAAAVSASAGTSPSASAAPSASAPPVVPTPTRPVYVGGAVAVPPPPKPTATATAAAVGTTGGGGTSATPAPTTTATSAPTQTAATSTATAAATAAPKPKPKPADDNPY